ncbi:MAG: hypothetical protein V1816_11520 [Pseudomonadota bacterium]
MRLNHVALVCRSEENSDRFFQGLLGLAKLRTKTAPADLVAALFGLERSFSMIDYGNEWMKFEIFLDPGAGIQEGNTAHVCLEVPDRPGLIERARGLNLEVRSFSREGRDVLFIRDFDGNLFEIK